MNQNLSSYWIFYTVANAGNISKAAKELYISQPAISKSIQKLEEIWAANFFPEVHEVSFSPMKARCFTVM